MGTIPPSPFSRVKGNEENPNKNPPSSLLCVWCLFSLLHPRACHPGVELGAEACLAGGGCGVEFEGWSRVVARLGWDHTPFPKTGCPGHPQTQNVPFLLESLGRKLSPQSPVPQTTHLAFGRRRGSRRLSGDLSCPLSCAQRPFSRPLLTFL